MLKQIGFFLVLASFAALSTPLRATEGESHIETESDSAAFKRIWAAVDIQFTPISYPNYQWEEGVYNNKSGSGMHVGLEMVAIDWVIGKVGVGTGTGFYTVSGVSLGDGTGAKLYTFPIESYLSYRLDLLENQVVVPFAKIGPSYTLTKQTSEDQTSWKSFTSLDYTIGGELLLNILDRKASASLYRTVGIQNTYFIFEYQKSRYLQGRGDANLSGEQYRVGLRFEM